MREISSEIELGHRLDTPMSVVRCSQSGPLTATSANPNFGVYAGLGCLTFRFSLSTIDLNSLPPSNRTLCFIFTERFKIWSAKTFSEKQTRCPPVSASKKITCQLHNSFQKKSLSKQSNQQNGRRTKLILLSIISSG